MSGVNAQQRLNNAQQVLRNQAAKTDPGEDKLGKKDFMNLFLTQMSHQNPTDPMDSGAMMSQMAQLGSMEQLENLNEGVRQLNTTQGKAANLQALGFLNKDVMLDGENMELTHGQGKAVYYDLKQDADHVRILIEAKDGSPVFKQDLGFVNAGKNRFLWDGKNDAGELMKDGNYKVSLMANKVDGTSEELMVYNSARVSGVDFKDGKAMLRVQGKAVPLSQVTSVDNLSTRLFQEAKPLPMIQELKPKGIMQD